MSRKRIKQYLMLLTVIGLVAVVGQGGGTFATFTAQTVNAGNYFSTGTLLLENSARGLAACQSKSDTTDNNNASCDWLFNVDLTDFTTAQEATLDLVNTGTLAASKLQFDAATPCATGKANAGGPVFGAGPNPADICDKLQIVIMETNAAHEHSIATNPALACVYPAQSVDANGTCPFDGTKTLANLPTTIGGAGSNLTSALAAPTSPALAGSNGTRHFVIAVQPDGTNIGNTYQNAKATFGLGWQIEQ